MHGFVLTLRFETLTLIIELDELKSTPTDEEISVQLQSTNEAVTLIAYPLLQLSDSK